MNFAHHLDFQDAKMIKRKELLICLGSSCFARGNKEIVQLIRKFLEEHELSHKVDFRGKHCFGHCEKGPGLRINGKHYDHIHADNIREILTSELLR